MSKAAIATIEKDVREQLLDTAEALFGQHGLDGVSLRQIGAAASQSNNSVVQYHFGDKAGLVRQIIERRIEQFEAKRGIRLLQVLEGSKSPDIKSLLEILLLPLSETTDARGQHVYARFMLQFMLQVAHYQGIPHPGWGDESAATKAIRLLRRKCAALPDAIFYRRFIYVTDMFLAALVERDNLLAAGKPAESKARFMTELFAMMSAALKASVRS